MCKVGVIVIKMYECIFEKIQLGMCKCDLVVEIYDVGICGMDGFGGDYLVIVLLLFLGCEVVVVYLIWDDWLMCVGEGMFFEIVGCYNCYYVLLLCMVFLGKLFKVFIEGEKVVLEGMEVGFEVVCVGNICEQFVGVFYVVLKKYGIIKDGCIGYGIGVFYLLDWGECIMLLCLGDKIVL